MHSLPRLARRSGAVLHGVAEPTSTIRRGASVEFLQKDVSLRVPFRPSILAYTLEGEKRRDRTWEYQLTG